MTTSPDIIGVGGIFIDEIMYPNQEKKIQLGGGVLYALQAITRLGCQPQPGLVGYIGHDFPKQHLPYFTQFCTQGLTTLNIPQIRALQIYQADGTRHEIPQTSDIDAFVEGPQPKDLPTCYRNTKAMYLIQSHEGIHRWKSHLPEFTLWEPNANFMTPTYRDDFRQALADIDIPIVSPNLREARAIYGDKSAEKLIQLMQCDGANIVALRMGTEGSLLANKKKLIHQPAIAVPTVVDETGAGNTYCGAFVYGMMHHQCMKTAARLAAQAAALCIQSVGLGHTTQSKHEHTCT